MAWMPKVQQPCGLGRQSLPSLGVPVGHAAPRTSRTAKAEVVIDPDVVAKWIYDKLPVRNFELWGTFWIHRCELHAPDWGKSGERLLQALLGSGPLITRE